MPGRDPGRGGGPGAAQCGEGRAGSAVGRRRARPRGAAQLPGDAAAAARAGRPPEPVITGVPAWRTLNVDPRGHAAICAGCMDNDLLFSVVEVAFLAGFAVFRRSFMLAYRPAIRGHPSRRPAKRMCGLCGMLTHVMLVYRMKPYEQHFACALRPRAPSRQLRGSSWSRRRRCSRGGSGPLGLCARWPALFKLPCKCAAQLGPLTPSHTRKYGSSGLSNEIKLPCAL